MKKQLYKKIILILLLVLLPGLPVFLSADGAEWGLGLSDEEKAFLKAHPVIRVQNERDWPPFNYIIGGEPQGYVVALVEELASRLGLEVEFVQGPDWNEFLGMLRKREIDMLCNIVRTPEREEYTVFTSPVLELIPSIISPVASPIGSMEELKGKTVAVTRGHWYQEDLEEHYPGMRILLTDTSLESLRALVEGDADAAIGYDLAAEYIISTQGYSQLEISASFQGRYEGTDALRLGFRRDWPLMATAFDKALASLTIRTEDELWDRWVDNPSDEGSLFTAEEMAYLDKKKVIRYSVDPSWLPVEGIDGEGRHIGISADLLALISERTGLVFELVPSSSWSETIDNLLSGRCDMLTLANRSPERDKVMDFTPRFIKQAVVLATGTDQSYFPEIDLLEGHIIAIVKDYSFQESLRRDYPGIRILEVDNITEGLRAVERGEAFGYMDSLTPIIYEIQRRGRQGLKVSGQFPEFDWDQSMAVREGEVLLQSILTKALGTLSETERHREYESWYSVEVEKGIDYSLLWRIVVGFSILLAVILFWNRSLSRSRKAARTALGELHRAQGALERMARTDKMTGLNNRARLDEVLEDEVVRAARYGSPLSLIICDLDWFKEVNDTYGHGEGDRLIRHFSGTLGKGSRRSDTVGRWGGEEFLLICPMTDGPSALVHAESLRQNFFDAPLEGLGIRSASFGAAQLREGETADELLIRADKALYRAKEKGRNRVELAP